MTHYRFNGCAVYVDHENRLVFTRFADGSEVVAAPDEQRDTALAHELGYADAWEMCAEHDLTHVRLAARRGEPSHVLWCKAHGIQPDPVVGGCEEQAVMDEQRRLCAERGGRGDAS